MSRRLELSVEARLELQVLLKRFPYAVIYIDLEMQVRVLAFAHVRRKPGYWKSR